jgi:selenocysteine lyase/cysteine desulfurase
LSFYKIFGYPTGVGCLLIRRDRFDVLTRPWFAGGTVTRASVAAEDHYLHRDEAAFEDGTVDYLNLPAVTSGLRYVERIGRDAIHRRVECLTGWLLDALGQLRHDNGRPVVIIHGPRTTAERGGTVSFTMYDRTGARIDDRRVEWLAGQAHISLRTGCFCNPGAAEAAHRLDAEGVRQIWREQGQPPSAIRISVGAASNFADVYRFLCFAQRFANRSTDDVAGAEFAADGFDPDAA